MTDQARRAAPDPATISVTQKVTQNVTLDLLDTAGDAMPVEAELRYEPDDPYAVTVAFLSGPDEVCWTFARDVLIDGVDRPTGDGDVHVRPCLDSHGHSVVIVELLSPHGVALVQARTRDLRPFINEMTAAVPAGAELLQVDVDAALAAIFVTTSGQ